MMVKTYVVFFGFLLVLLTSSANAQKLKSIDFVKIAETGDDPPGVTEAFTDFDITFGGNPTQINAPATDGTRVAFVGRDANVSPGSQSNSGIFVGSGNEMVPIADRSTDAPGLVEGFDSFSEPAISIFGIVFSGRDASFRSGIFFRPPGGISLLSLVQFFDDVPDTSDKFNGVRIPNISGAQVAFSGNFPAGVGDQNGIFLKPTAQSSRLGPPTISTIAVTGDDPPGPVGPITFFGPFDGLTNEGKTVIFVAQDAQFKNGIFLAKGGRVKDVISDGDLLPGSAGDFIGADFVDMDHDTLVFNGIGSAGHGIYRADLTNGKVTKIADTSDQSPGNLGTFNNLQVPAVEGSIVAFTASDGVNQGLYVSIKGTLHTILDTSQMLDGKPVAHLTFGAQGFAAKSLAFGVEFEDGSQAIYRADLTVK